ncbi:hypothetical protein UlMin_040994 [Ulmus minor]
MKKSKGDEDKPDGLEITSIGSLYNGPWDKKYWSSSRGKDRYPYPVGYQAVRAHNGSTYKMEIHEGPKGPLFMITSADGHSSSGQTPIIAWNKFQKECFPRMKIWHGKRFSCNIDGVEFFGFKNSFVQRLLREMVANVNATPEQNLLSSSFYKEAPKADGISCLPDACTTSDVLPCLARSQTTRKRSRKAIKAKSPSGANLKRYRPQDLTYVAEASDALEEGQRNHNFTNSELSLKEDYDNCERSAGLPLSMNSIPVEEEKTHTSENCLPLNSIDTSNHLRKITAPAEEKGNFKSTDVPDSLPYEEKHPDRFQDTEVEDTFSMALEVKDGDVTGLEDCQVTNADLCAPDTFDDLLQDNTSDNCPKIDDKRTYSVKEDLAAADMVILDSLVSESPPEEEIGTFSSNASFQKSDLDSVGQETANFMMSFLLPQAIPLLKKSSKSRKKKATVSPLEVLARAHSEKENKEIDVSSPGPVSLKTDAEADQTSFKDEKCPDRTFGQVIGTWEHKDSIKCHLETSEIKDILHNDDEHMELNVIPQKTLNKTASLPSCTTYKNDFAEIQNSYVNLDRDLVAFGKPDVKLQRTLSSSDITPREANFETELAETANMSMTQVPKLVYSRRKKVQTLRPLKGKYNGPLSESIICRSFEDTSVSVACPATGTSLASETLHLGSSDEKILKKDISGAEANFLGQSRSLHAVKSTITSKSLLTNKDSAALQDDLICSSKDEDTIHLLDQSNLHVQKSQSDVVKEVVEDKNHLVSKSSDSSQKQGISFSNSSLPIAKEAQYCSKLKPETVKTKNDFLSIFQLLGCYEHPLPVLAVMLSTEGSEIHISVLCGPLVGNNRTLFIYNVVTQEPMVGYPSFVGHTSLTLPTLKDYFGREIALERSGLQFAPGGQYLVVLDSIRMPYCSQGRIPCLCSACASATFEENAVKIVKVKLGYVSVVVQLKTEDRIQCLLVCEPNNLVAVGESGRLHLWIMNSTWSEQTDKFTMPADDCISTGIVELKRIPNCAFLVVGHNGFGEFSLWDILRRNLVSKFSALNTSICEFYPISFFSWQKEPRIFCDPVVDGHVNRMMAATKKSLSEQAMDGSFQPLEGENIAVWLLVSVMSDSDAQDDYISGYRMNSVGWWRLALLVKNTVILGSAMDPSAAVIGASSGHGIIGTYDGLVYVCEMSTGAKLGTLHHFKGGSVSCIATDDSKKGVVAIAGGEGQLLVYLPSQNVKPD